MSEFGLQGRLTCGVPEDAAPHRIGIWDGSRLVAEVVWAPPVRSGAAVRGEIAAARLVACWRALLLNR